MKIIAPILLALLLPGKAFAAQPLTVAVLDFESKDANVRDLGPKIALLITAELSGNPDLYTLERAELEKALGEQELGLSGTVSPDSAAKVGQLTGAKVLVTGRIFKLGKETLGVAKIMSTETSRVFAQSASGSGEDALGGLALELAGKVSQILEKHRESFLAQGLSSEERMAAFLKQYEPAEKLKIAVTIPEQHYGAPANDPAAQTELQSVFQKAGFEIVDAESDAKPDIQITGEAFSAFGLLRGNLTSCKARLEIIARDRKNGAILHADKETSVAVDITEQTAAKTALENAAREVAIRLLTKLKK